MDIDAGNALVEAIGPLARATARPGTGAALGGFGALFDLKAAGFKDAILVASTDGVGTKLKIAIEAERHDSVGIDLVAMCANDLVVQGAEPLFFLDYFATGKLELEVGKSIVAGIAEGCTRAGCALVGGETAEMPGLYAGSDYDLAGFCVGAAERDALLTGATIEPGDLILGLASDGLHSNGFSLVRKVVAGTGLRWDADCPFEPGQTLAEALLVPTRIYVKSCLAALAHGGVKAYAHITGGGLIENLPRVLPAGLVADLEAGSWPIAPAFRWLAQTAGIPAMEMLRTFNCGLGMVAVVSPEAAPELQALLSERGERVFQIGHIAPGEGPTARVAIDAASLPWNG